MTRPLPATSHRKTIAPIDLERRAKTLALMMNPPRPQPERMHGHRQWMVPLAERRR